LESAAVATNVALAISIHSIDMTGFTPINARAISAPAPIANDISFVQSHSRGNCYARAEEEV
jgi:hypothetical protein